MTLTIATLLLALLIAAKAGYAGIAHPRSGVAHVWHNGSLPLAKAPAVRAIVRVFGPYAGQAIRVAGCESNYLLTARNGQYLGLFQMGSWERVTYARGRYSTYMDQTLAAWRYFVATGRDWSPWACKPW